MGNFYVIYQLARKIQGYAPSAAAFTAFTLCHFPILHFFTFFYYTDTGLLSICILKTVFSVFGYADTTLLRLPTVIVSNPANLIYRCDKIKQMPFSLSVGSTFMVLLMYLLSLHESHVMAAFIGYVAVIFRQTNIVWVFFTGAQSCLL